MIILGINAYHGDSAACLLRDGVLVAAAEEERFRRIKHWAGFPSMAIQYCLQEAGLTLEDVDHITISRNPRAHLHRKVLFTLSKRPSFDLIRNRLSQMAKVGDVGQALQALRNGATSPLKAQVHRVEHHRSHSGSAFFVSPFEEAAVVSIDAFGDFVSTMLSDGQGRRLKVLDWVEFPHSVGLVYTAVTQYLGFHRYGDEYKVMGLAAYGQPEYLDEFRQMVRLKKGGKFELDLDYFIHHAEGVSMTWNDCEPVVGRAHSDKFVERLGPVRQPGEEILPRHRAIAASLQARLEEVYFHVLNAAFERTGKKALCLAGGVAFNSVANGKIFDNTPFEDVYIQPAAGDAGTAVGSAYYLYHQVLGNRRNFVMDSAFWGPHYADTEVEALLNRYELPHQCLDEEALVQRTAQAVAQGKVVGWFQGRMEWGPRALGNRSILVDPRRAEMKELLNERIKRREPFRPFAPSIMVEAVSEYFEETYPDPFMLKVYPIKADKRAVIPAVTHVDGTGRLQTVSKTENPRYWRLLSELKRLTGVPIVLNTSFNENEPIVCSPMEALECYLRTRMDVLVMGNYLVEKSPGAGQ